MGRAVGRGVKSVVPRGSTGKPVASPCEDNIELLPDSDLSPDSSGFGFPRNPGVVDAEELARLLSLAIPVVSPR